MSDVTSGRKFKLHDTSVLLLLLILLHRLSFLLLQVPPLGRLHWRPWFSRQQAFASHLLPHLWSTAVLFENKCDSPPPPPPRTGRSSSCSDFHGWPIALSPPIWVKVYLNRHHPPLTTLPSWYPPPPFHFFPNCPHTFTKKFSSSRLKIANPHKASFMIPAPWNLLAHI